MLKPYFKLTKNSSSSQPFQFVPKAPNHETIGTSETYSSMQMCKHGIDAVIKGV